MKKFFLVVTFICLAFIASCTGDTSELTSSTTTNNTTDDDIVGEEYNLTLVSINSLNDSHSFMQVQVEGGSFMALTTEHRIFVWGDNYYGKLGYVDNVEDTSIYYSAQEITSLFNFTEDEYIIDIALGPVISIFLTNLGSVYGMGCNANYTIGSEEQCAITPNDFTGDITLTVDEKIIDVIIVDYTTILVTDKNRVLRLGVDYNDETNQTDEFVCVEITANLDLEIDDNIKSVNVTQGGDFILITDFGRVFSYNSNNIWQYLDIDFGELEEITEYISCNGNEVVTDVFINNLYDVFHTSSGRYLAIGHLSRFIENYSSEELCVDVTQFFGLNEGETIIATPYSENMSPRMYVSTSDYRILYWGANMELMVNQAVYESYYYSYDITEQVDLDDDEYLVDVEDDTYNNSVALTSKGRILTWGEDISLMGDYYEDESLNFYTISDYIDLNENEDIVSIKYGGYRNTSGIAYTTENRIFVWGDNSYGLLGIGNETYFFSSPYEITDQFLFHEGEEIAEFDIFYNQAVLLTSEGRVFIWGYDYQGILGLGGSWDVYLPTEITDLIPIEVGDHIVSVFAQAMFTIYITENGYMYYSGTDIDYPAEATCYSDVVSPGEKVVQAVGFERNIMLLTDSGRVLTMGYNSYGQLGNGGTERNFSDFYDVTQNIVLDQDEIIIDIEYYDGFCVALTDKGVTYIWGNNQKDLVQSEETTILLPEIYDFGDVLDTELIVDVEVFDEGIYLLCDSNDLYLYQIDSLDNSIVEFFNQLDNELYKFDKDLMLAGETIEKISSSHWNIVITTNEAIYSYGSDMVGISYSSELKIVHEPSIITEQIIIYEYMEELDQEYVYYLDYCLLIEYTDTYMPRMDMLLFVKE